MSFHRPHLARTQAQEMTTTRNATEGIEDPISWLLTS